MKKTRLTLAKEKKFLRKRYSYAKKQKDTKVQNKKAVFEKNKHIK